MVHSYDEASLLFARTYLQEVLREAQGCVAKAARLAGRNRTNFYRLLRRVGINPRDFQVRVVPDNASAALTQFLRAPSGSAMGQ